MRPDALRGYPRSSGVAAVLALVALAATACHRQRPTPVAPAATNRAPSAEPPLRIATWNIQRLRDEVGEGRVARTHRDYARLREYANELDADVIALQEVDGEGAARRVFDPSVYDFHFSSRNDVQLTGFAYDQELDVEANPDFTDLDVGHLRYGTDITVRRGDFRLRLLSIHLKSGCWGDELDASKRACEKLDKQLSELEEWIDARATGGVPFAVLGDFNRRLSPGDEFWREIDDGEPPNADLLNVTEGRTSACWGGEYPEYIDHIVLGRRAARRLVPGSFSQLVFDDSDAAHEAVLSDHCPISVALDGRPVAEMSR